MAISLETARQLFQYDPIIGDLCRDGKIVGYLFESKPGVFYRRVKVYGYQYMVHRLIWFIVTGEWPTNQIDHWDGNSLNNSWDNLREATDSQNKANAKGPAIDIVGNKFRAKITINYAQIYLGVFDTYKEAEYVYKEASIKLFGEYSKYQRQESVSLLNP